MFYLRLARGYRVLDLGRWILTAAASAAVAALLLRALGRALVDPPGTAVAVSVARLYWCLPPLAALAWLSAACARALPAQRPDRMAGLVAAGAGPVRIRLLVAGEVALACTLGSLTALLAFLVLRNNIAGARLAPEVGMGATLPAAAPLTLLLLVPLLGAAVAAGAVPVPEAVPGQSTTPAPPPAGPLPPAGALRIAVAGTAVVGGVLLELYGMALGGSGLRLPARLGTITALVAAGWALALLGLALAVAPLLCWAGRLLASGHPYAVRLLAGRGLEAEAGRLGAPLGSFAFTAAALFVAVRRWLSGTGPGGPLPWVEATLVGVCAVAAVLTRLIEVRAARRQAVAPVRRLGASAALLRGAAVLRALAAGTVVLATAAAAALLTAAALGG